jgi:predicted MFS family arabinose efflux permease
VSVPRALAFSGYRALIATPPVRRLLLSSLVARMPLGMNSLALLLLVRGKSASFALAGVVVGAYSLARAGAVPVQGALIDRFGPRWFLLPCAAAQAVLLAGVVVAVRWNGSPLLMISLGGLAGAFTPPISTCLRTLWRRIVGPNAALDTAYTMDATSQEVIWVLAPLLAALLVGIASPSALVLCSAGIGLYGTAYFAASPYVRGWRGDDQGPRRPMGALRSRGLRVLLACAALTSVGWGALQVGLPALAVHSGSRQSAGVLLGLWGLGSVIGGFLSGARVWRSSASSRYIVLLWLSALSVAPLIGARTLSLAIGLSLVAGLALSPLNSCQWSLIDTVALPGTVSEAFAWDIGVIAAGMAAGTIASGLLIDRIGLWASFTFGCASTAAAAIVAMKTTPTIGS